MFSPTAAVITGSKTSPCTVAIGVPSFCLVQNSPIFRTDNKKEAKIKNKRCPSRRSLSTYRGRISTCRHHTFPSESSLLRSAQNTPNSRPNEKKETKSSSHGTVLAHLSKRKGSVQQTTPFRMVSLKGVAFHSFFNYT